MALRGKVVVVEEAEYWRGTGESITRLPISHSSGLVYFLPTYSKLLWAGTQLGVKSEPLDYTSLEIC